MTAIAPTLICFLNLLLTPLRQFPKILAALFGGCNVKANWMTSYIDLAKRYWKNTCFIVSI
jgi:hypothetical protein